MLDLVMQKFFVIIVKMCSPFAAAYIYFSQAISPFT